MIAGDERDQRGSAPDAPSVWPAVLVVTVATAAIAAAVGVRGDFSLNDDWSYAYTTRVLCTDGVLRFLPWTGATLILQAGYGALLCKLFGFSFTVLRASTIVLAAAGALGCVLVLRECGVRGATRAIAVIVVALNPIYLNLAFTFMTDVPFTVAAVWAGVWYARGLRSGRTATLVAGSVAATAAVLIRQHGLLVALAAAAAALLDERPAPAPARGASDPSRTAWRPRLAAATAVLVLPTLAFVLFHVWLFGVHGSPQGYVNKLGEAQTITITALANTAFRGLAYLGLFLSPITFALAPATDRRTRRLTRATFVALAVVAAALYARSRALMPYLTNVIYDFGLGALTLRDTLFLGLTPPQHLGPFFEIALTILALAGAAVLAVRFVSMLAARDVDTAAAGNTATRDAAEPARSDVAVRFVALAAVLLFAGSLLHVRYYFDRYLLPVVPFAAAALLGSARRPSLRAPSIVLAAIVSWYAIAGTHDYLAWNRARYAGLEALRADGVPVTAIDGGFEFNAWNLAAQLGTWPTDAQSRMGQPATLRSWWWVIDDRFVASFRPLDGYRVYRELPYPRWLVPGTGRVLILERTATGAGAERSGVAPCFVDRGRSRHDRAASAVAKPRPRGDRPLSFAAAATARSRVFTSASSVARRCSNAAVSGSRAISPSVHTDARRTSGAVVDSNARRLGTNAESPSAAAIQTAFSAAPCPGASARAMHARASEPTGGDDRASAISALGIVSSMSRTSRRAASRSTRSHARPSGASTTNERALDAAILSASARRWRSAGTASAMRNLPASSAAKATARSGAPRSASSARTCSTTAARPGHSADSSAPAQRLLRAIIAARVMNMAPTASSRRRASTPRATRNR